jgi:Tfp pilus assembly protein PilN
MNTTLNRRQAELGTAKVELAQVSLEEQERMAAVSRIREAQSIVQVRGLPWSDILFHVSGSMPEGVWLTSLGVESGNSLALEGTALSATSVAVLMEALTRSPLFVNPEMRSIQKDTSVASHTLVRYQVRTQLVPPSLASSPAAAPPPPPAALTTAGGAL